MAKVIQDQRVKAGVVVVINELVQDEEVYQAVLALCHRILEDEGVRNAVSEMLIKSSHNVSPSHPSIHYHILFPPAC